MLSPASFIVAALSIFMIYFIDQFLLFRRWKAVPMFGPELKKRLRQFISLAVCGHLYISATFAYSWPMDAAYMHSDQSFERVNKAPRYYPWMMEKQYWHSSYQGQVLAAYKWFFYASLIVVIYGFLGKSVLRGIKNFVCYRSE